MEKAVEAAQSGLTSRVVPSATGPAGLAGIVENRHGGTGIPRASAREATRSVRVTWPPVREARTDQAPRHGAQGVVVETGDPRAAR